MSLLACAPTLFGLVFSDVPNNLCDHCVCVCPQALLQWWAQFCESNGDFVSAVRYYNSAEDALSLVRLYCFNNEFDTVCVYESPVHVCV